MTVLDLALYRYRQLRIAGHTDPDMREAMFLWNEGPQAYLRYATSAYPQRAHPSLDPGSLN